ncbi:MAG: DUF3343 domain-containing protein [Candidatus Ruminococcus intestinipullorum]|nr:DUF3343 domain-containing protein [Candidatus Ruminococcus intestinipullorum]
MKEKELRIVVAFETTTAAMQFESHAKCLGIQGRIIPVPREITSGCGLSFSTPIGERKKVEELVKQLQIGKVYELIL